MTALCLTIDDVLVAAVDLTQVDMLAVHLHGSLHRPDMALLSCHGGTYPADAPSTFRSWAEQVLPRAGQAVTVRLADSVPAGQVTQGRTLAELYPDEPPCARTDFTPTPQEKEALRRQPRVRTGFSWALTTPEGDQLAGRNGADDDSFAFSVLWTQDRPHQARVRFSASNIDNVLRRAGGTDLYQGRLDVGASVTFRCGD